MRERIDLIITLKINSTKHYNKQRGYMKDSIVISPIFYMGNKKKIINKGLIDLFPDNIHRFIDLFSGSAIVAMNAKSEEFIINDTDSNLYDLYTLFKTTNSQDIISHIQNRIDEYGLARERTKRNQFEDKEKIDLYKKAYTNLRTYYNSNHNILDFYTLMFYSFSQQFRFNSKGEFNMPCGNDCFSDKNEDYIKNGCSFFSKPSVKITNFDFRKLSIGRLKSDDFVYLDPPYFNTTATYNENNGWSMQDDLDLFEVCEQLSSHNIRFGMSNVFKCKGKENTHLIEWCEKCGWNVYTFDNFTYMACGKGNSEAKEVFICNY